jgi:hypothetical protein
LYDQGRQFEYGRKLDQETPGKATRIFKIAKQGRKWSTEEIIDLAKDVERENREIREALE